MNLGMNVTLTMAPPYTRLTVLHNVTEIHYLNRTNIELYAGRVNPNSDLLQPRIAFESDVHGTGITYALKDVLEFEAKVATEKADIF